MRYEFKPGDKVAYTDVFLELTHGIVPSPEKVKARRGRISDKGNTEGDGIIVKWDDGAEHIVHRDNLKVIQEDLLSRLMRAAEETIPQAVYEGEGEKTFDIGIFINSLEIRIIDELDQLDRRTPDERSNITLHSWHVARFLWACIASKEGDGETYPKTFRGMPVVD